MGENWVTPFSISGAFRLLDRTIERNVAGASNGVMHPTKQPRVQSPVGDRLPVRHFQLGERRAQGCSSMPPEGERFSALMGLSTQSPRPQGTTGKWRGRRSVAPFVGVKCGVLLPRWQCSFVMRTDGPEQKNFPGRNRGDCQRAGRFRACHQRQCLGQHQGQRA